MKATVLRKVRRRCWNKARKRSKLKNMWTASMVGAPVMVLMLEVTLACRGSEMALIEFVLQLRQLTTCWSVIGSSVWSVIVDLEFIFIPCAFDLT